MMIDRNASARIDPVAEGVQAEWLGAMQSLAEQIQKQQAFQQMTQGLMKTYMQLLNISISYAQEDLREVRHYEERNKHRETILDQLDRRTRSGS